MLAKYPKPAGCADCSLFHTGVGFAPASGPAASRLLFVGESLGYNEALHGEPFVGAAGGMFYRMLKRVGLSREQVKVHNTVNCRPPDDWIEGAPWQHSALSHCSPYLEQSLSNPSLQVVVTLGNVPMRQVLQLWGMDGVRVQDFHGTVHRDPTDRVWVVPTYHPSHLQRGSINLLDVTRHDLEVAIKLLNTGRPNRRPFDLFIDPPVEQFRAWATTLLARFTQEGFGWLATDIETPDKSGGRDEGELSTEDTSTQILRINFASHGAEGWTVPYAGPYVPIIRELLDSGLWLALWNKWYDESRLRFNGHRFQDSHGDPITLIDGMWAAHHLQSDLPLGLGFWAPFHSDYGAWKHLGKQKGMEGEYAAVDGLQTYRVVPEGIVPALQQEGLWDTFWRHTHQREQYVLRPAHENGMPIDETKLDQFHDRLQVVAADRLTLINQSQLTGSYHPKAGYKKAPTGKDGGPPVPPKGISGTKHRKRGDHAKADYLDQGITLVQREVDVTNRVCAACGKSSVGSTHNCLGRRKPRKRSNDAGAKTHDHHVEIPGDAPGDEQIVPEIRTELCRESRWFWKLPFNPDANAQILRFIRDSGETPGKAKKTKKDTANKNTLRVLFRKTGNPVYKQILDYKAIKKVDSTYALGAKKRIWKSDGRLHPFYTFRPSMFRDSYVNPNIQNVIADKEGKSSLAAGFRYCIVADPGYRFIEIDYAGTEAVDTGWFIGDPHYIRLATLGVHAYLTSHLLAEAGKIGEAASLSWSDADLAKFFKEIKEKFPQEYDKSKRCVHGNNYGLTIFGMVENFPDVFQNLKDAQHTQDLYYSIAPGLPAFHQKLRDVAYDTEQVGGPYIDDYYLLTSGKYHPFAYRHKFYGVQTYKPLTESEYRRLQWIAKNKMKRDRHPRVRMVNGRPFEVVLGEDSKRVIALYPQSNSAGKLKEAELALLHPDSQDYIGEVADGKTPLVAPIHDSLLFHVPDRIHELVITVAVEVMRRPLLQMPCPAEWGIGSHIRTNVDVKVSPVGGSWGDIESISIPDMAAETAREVLYLPVEEDQYEDIGELETRIIA